MIFSSTIFLFGFLPIVILVNLVLDKKIRNIWLALASILFYAWAEPINIWIILATIVFNWLFGLLIDKSKERYRRLLLIVGVGGNVLGLAYFKYYNWIADIINNIVSCERIKTLDILLPIGISFFTFKAISYLSDVYMKRCGSEHSIINMTVYLALFPEILSGPIDRYVDLKEKIHEREIKISELKIGIERFIYGLFKKVILANSLGIIVDTIWAQGAGTSSWKVAWLGSIAYSLQIYFDFAGYTDMAVGIGKMLGFNLTENFNYPYIADSITDFWRRWHISLGNWFKNYIYIPLGGNRRHVYFNLFMVFLLTGVWHGAAWNFVIWGLLHGLLRLLEKKLDNYKFNNKIVTAFRHIYLLVIVNFLWVLFRAPSITEAVLYLKSMFGFMSVIPSGLSLMYYFTRYNVVVLIIALLLCVPIMPRLYRWVELKSSCVFKVVGKDIFLIILLLLSIFRLVTENYNTFIYFQF